MTAPLKPGDLVMVINRPMNAGRTGTVLRQVRRGERISTSVGPATIAGDGWLVQPARSFWSEGVELSIGAFLTSDLRKLGGPDIARDVTWQRRIDEVEEFHQAHRDAQRLADLFERFVRITSF